MQQQAEGVEIHIMLPLSYMAESVLMGESQMDEPYIFSFVGQRVINEVIYFLGQSSISPGLQKLRNLRASVAFAAMLHAGFVQNFTKFRRSRSALSTSCK